MPIFFNEQRFTFQSGLTNSYTNSLQISFIPQPAPNVTQVTTNFGPNACQGINGTGPFTNCIPLVSYINLAGQYMYDMAVTVGGVPCASLVTQSASLTRCLLPALSGTGPFDLVVSDPQAATTNYYTRSGFISYTANPSLASITTCTDTGATNFAGFWFGGICNEGQSITVTGTNFPTSDPTVQVVATWIPQNFFRPPWGQNPIPVYCANPTILSSSSIVCTLPYLSTLTGASQNASYAFYGSNVQLNVTFASGSISTNNLNLQLYAVPNSPVIYSVTGCAVSNSALQMSYCGSGSLITITGSNFAPASFGGPTSQSISRRRLSGDAPCRTPAPLRSSASCPTSTCRSPQSQAGRCTP